MVYLYDLIGLKKLAHNEQFQMNHHLVIQSQIFVSIRTNNILQTIYWKIWYSSTGDRALLQISSGSDCDSATGSGHASHAESFPTSDTSNNVKSDNSVA